jgi:MOSC domain-containing protein YiiM
MKVVSVNVGKIQSQPWRDGTLSGMHKSAIEGGCAVSNVGLAGDEQADTKNHGGEDKAVFVMPESNYAYFNIQQPFGFLGENLTLSGLDETEVCLGDRLQIGTVLLEVSQPRSPCWKLGQQASSGSDWSSADFLKSYSESGRVGFYCRVLATGVLEQGQSVTWLTRDDSEEHQAKSPYKITIEKLFLAKQFHSTEVEWGALQSVVQHPALSVAWQKSIENLLQNHSAQKV